MSPDDFSRLPPRRRRADVLWPAILALVLCAAVVAVVVPLFAVADPYLSPSEADRRHCEGEADRRAEAEVGDLGSADLLGYRAEQLVDVCLERLMRERFGSYEGAPD